MFIDVLQNSPSVNNLLGLLLLANWLPRTFQKTPNLVTLFVTKIAFHLAILLSPNLVVSVDVGPAAAPSVVDA